MTRMMVLGTMLAAGAAMVYGDDRGRYGYDPNYGRGGYGNGGYGNGGYGNDRYGNDRYDRGYRGENYRSGGPIAAALRDLQEIYSRARVDNHESNHFRKAIDALRDFDERARRGRFEGKYLDRALDNMSHLAAADQLHPRARDVIRMRMHDLERMGNPGYGY